MARGLLSKIDDWQLVNDEQDIRGWEVRDASGSLLGTVDELIADTEAERIVALLLDNGTEIAASQIDIGDDRTVHVRGEIVPGPDAGTMPGPNARIYDDRVQRRR